MSYSIITMGGNLLPAVWPVSATTQEEALKEAHEMRVSKLHLHPALLIDWEQGGVVRIAVSSNPDVEPEIFDNAGELFGIATTSEYFEEIANALDAKVAAMDAGDCKQ